jgi:hypothetical protein
MSIRLFGILLLASVASTSEAELTCPGDSNLDGQTTIDEIMAAVVAALDGCAAVVPTPTCPPPPAGRTCTPFETYQCVTDLFGCQVCDCCNFESVGGCCQLSDGCFGLESGGDAAECVVNRHGQIVSGCPIHAFCDASTATCKQQLPPDRRLLCPGDNDGDGVTTVDEIVAGIDAALNGCGATPTPEPPATASSTIAQCTSPTRGCGEVETPTPGPLATNTEFFPTCCQFQGRCRDPRSGGAFLCSRDEQSFGAPHVCNVETGECEVQ